MTKPKFSVKRTQVEATVSVQFTVSGVIGAELRSVLDAAGYRVTGENGDMLWMTSPDCRTPAEIGIALPAVLRQLVQA